MEEKSSGLVVKSERHFPLSKYSEAEFQSGGFKIGFKREDNPIVFEYTASIGIMVFMTTLTVTLPSDTVSRLGPIGVILMGALLHSQLGVPTSNQWTQPPHDVHAGRAWHLPATPHYCTL